MSNKPKKQMKLFIKSNKRASIGIGAMIVFIAMVLVAGIAASVLIHTSNQLEMQALKTGHETRKEVSSDITVTEVTGQYGTRVIDGTAYSRYHNMTILVTPLSGSEINLDTVIIEITDSAILAALEYDSEKFSLQPSGSGVFSTSGVFDLNASKFGIIVIEDADGSCTSETPVINHGDKTLLTVNLSASFKGFAGRTKVRGTVITEHGSPGLFLFTTPTSTLRTVVKLM